MITNRLDNPQLVETLKEADRALADARGASITETRTGYELDVWVELPDGFEYSWGHTGFGMSTTHANGPLTHLDVWHDVLKGISFPVIETGEEEELCESCSH